MAAAEDLRAKAPSVNPESSPKDDNPSASAADTSANTFRFRAPSTRRKTKPRSRELQQQPRLSEDIDNLYLEEATCRTRFFASVLNSFRQPLLVTLNLPKTNPEAKYIMKTTEYLGILTTELPCYGKKLTTELKSKPSPPPRQPSYLRCYAFKKHFTVRQFNPKLSIPTFSPFG